jgi:hypothetical protein
VLALFRCLRQTVPMNVRPCIVASYCTLLWQRCSFHCSCRKNRRLCVPRSITATKVGISLCTAVMCQRSNRRKLSRSVSSIQLFTGPYSLVPGATDCGLSLIARNMAYHSAAKRFHHVHPTGLSGIWGHLGLAAKAWSKQTSITTARFFQTCLGLIKSRTGRSIGRLTDESC